MAQPNPETACIMSDKWHAINEHGERLYNQIGINDALILAREMDSDSSNCRVTVIIREDVTEQELRDVLSDIADYYDND